MFEETLVAETMYNFTIDKTDIMPHPYIKVIGKFAYINTDGLIVIYPKTSPTDMISIDPDTITAVVECVSIGYSPMIGEVVRIADESKLRLGLVVADTGESTTIICNDCGRVVSFNKSDGDIRVYKRNRTSPEAGSEIYVMSHKMGIKYITQQYVKFPVVAISSDGIVTLKVSNTTNRDYNIENLDWYYAE